DNNGKFVEKDHNAIIDAAFGKILTVDKLSILKQASRNVDNNHQSLKEQYMHGMSSPGQSKEDAQKQFNAFVGGKKEEYKKDPDKGLYSLGEGMHALMDSKCKEHEGFQVWIGNPIGQDETSGLKTVLGAAGAGGVLELIQGVMGGIHWLNEKQPTKEEFNAAVKEIQEYYFKASDDQNTQTK
ncbi:MAG: hypothetical protein WCT77_07015, partial [Bacteroidota bacterium]